MKDNFSSQSNHYAKYRPVYPETIFDFLNKKLSHTGLAWDCATGNGQIAVKLAAFFDRVEATDISENQLKEAPKLYNINYSLQPAEKVNFKDNSFDLIMVGQAIHWFDFDLFCKEVKRTLKPDGILCILGYSLFESNPATNVIIQHFYKEVIGPYWDPERKYLDDHYNSIPFPFKELSAPAFPLQLKWSLEELIGYLQTWSAVKHFITKNGYDPVDKLKTELHSSFGNENLIKFPILIKIGKLPDK